MNDTFNIKKHVAKVLLSSSVLNKYKVKFKVCNKMLIGIGLITEQEHRIGLITEQCMHLE